MRSLKSNIYAALGGAIKSGGYSPARYHNQFRASGIEKAKTIIAALQSRSIDLEGFAYFSIGGSTGSEVIHVLENTPIKFGYLLDIDSKAAEFAREEAKRLWGAKKTLEVCCGDAMQQMSKCKGDLLAWRNKHKIRGLVVSAQAVLHELVTRSPNFKLSYVLGEAFWDWDPCVFICREPCAPIGWPEEIELGIPSVPSDLLSQLAIDIRAKLNMHKMTVLTAGPDYVTLSPALAIELLFKLFYIADYQYEIGERITSFASDDLAQAIEARLGHNTLSRVNLNSISFEMSYRAMGVNVRTPTGQPLPMPNVFTHFLAIRQKHDIGNNVTLGANRVKDKRRNAVANARGTDASAFAKRFKLLNSQKNAVLDVPTIPWSAKRNPRLRYLWPKVIVDPWLTPLRQISGSMTFGTWVTAFQWDGNIGIIGQPGSGKSTTLRQAFLRLIELRKRGDQHYPVIGHASEFVEYFRNPAADSLLCSSIREARGTDQRLVWLVDGLDELGAASSRELIASLLTIRPPRETFWVTARSDYFVGQVAKISAIMARLRDTLELAEWDVQRDARTFVDRFARKAKLPNLLPTFDKIKLNKSTRTFLTNPFTLSLVIYLASDKTEIGHNLTNVFTLYRTFYKQWVARETQRKTSGLGRDAISKMHSAIALRIFKARRTLACVKRSDLRLGKAIRHSAFSGLLRNTSQGLILGFRHETIGEYLIAEQLLGSLRGSSNRLHTLLSDTYTHEINHFVRNGMALLNDVVVKRIVRRLSLEYYAYLRVAHPADKHLKRLMERSAPPGRLYLETAPDRNIRIRQQLLYYIGCVASKEYPEALTIAFKCESHPLLLRIAALGAILHGKMALERKYLRLLRAGSSWDIENRSVQLVYFGDVSEDMYVFRDTGKITWARAREAILARIASGEARDIRLRWWDLRTFALFVISRPETILTHTEMSIIHSAVPRSGLTREKRLVLFKEQQRIIDLAVGRR